MDHGIDWLNSLPVEQAEQNFLKCCGSSRWAGAMTIKRPFAEVDDLIAEAGRVWWSLDKEDWLEAFRSHPKIGEKSAEKTQSVHAKAWSEQEQSGTRESTDETMTGLAAANEAYANRFGYIFIICATGKTAKEMLTSLHERLRHNPDEELRIAAEEQNKITNLRLGKLIN
jgi:OHCU decarboxylase